MRRLHGFHRAGCDRDFCEVAIKDESGLRLAGSVRSSLAKLELFAQSLSPDDELALARATGRLGLGASHPRAMITVEREVCRCALESTPWSRRYLK
jgi:hypothetical protein